MDFSQIISNPLVIAISVAIVFFVLLFVLGYVKAPPDTAVIISGIRKNPRVLIGRAGVKIPFLERTDRLLLKQITIDIKTGDRIPTKDFINISVDAVAKVRVGTSDEMIKLAMKNFLNKSEQQIIIDLQDSLQGNMREIIGTMALKEICNDRNGFGNGVQESATPDMNKLGIEILSCNIQNITDSNGLIQDMGMDNTSKIKKDAAIAKAESERDVAIAEAEAKKLANDAQVKSETEIAERNNELEIKKANLKIESDKKKAEADAAYDIMKEEQRKQIEVNSTDADIAKQQRQVELKRTEAEVEEQALAAQIKKKADADKYAAQQSAEVELYRKQKEAEARKYEREQEAEALKAEADAKRYAAEQEAAGIKNIGEAEAAAIKAKGIAEAEGIDKKAEAMKKMGEASVLEMFFKAYPEIMAAAAKPLENVDTITMFGEGNSAKVVGDIVNSTKQIMSGIETSTGVDIKSLLLGFFGGKYKAAENDNPKYNTEVTEEEYNEFGKKILKKENNEKNTDNSKYDEE